MSPQYPMNRVIDAYDRDDAGESERAALLRYFAGTDLGPTVTCDLCERSEYAEYLVDLPGAAGRLCQACWLAS